MRVLFLDIDGVLNSDQTEIRSVHGNYIFIEEKYILRLKQIVDSTACTLIMTAAERKGYTSPENSTARKYLDEVLEKLASYGITVSGYVEDLKNVPTEKEILIWLKDRLSEVESYAVIDDHIRADGLAIKRRLVSPDMVYGLREEEAAQCIRLLKAPLSDEEREVFRNFQP